MYFEKFSETFLVKFEKESRGRNSKDKLLKKFIWNFEWQYLKCIWSNPLWNFWSKHFNLPFDIHACRCPIAFAHFKAAIMPTPVNGNILCFVYVKFSIFVVKTGAEFMNVNQCYCLVDNLEISVCTIIFPRCWNETVTRISGGVLWIV